MRALLSVYDKEGVVDLARALVDAGWELLSSGGTARVIADAGLAVTDVADHTGDRTANQIQDAPTTTEYQLTELKQMTLVLIVQVIMNRG